MKVSDLTQEEYDPYYSRYINVVPVASELRLQFEVGMLEVIQFFKFAPEDKLDYRYAQGKWTIKEILQHLIDTERIFMYRIFRIARNDKTALASFDQNIYNLPSKASSKSLSLLIDEYHITRKASISLLSSLSDEDLGHIGVSSMVPMSARAAAFTIVGHEIWHMNIIKEKYL
ncbi:MAG: DinB family protein [Cyclobacteriaceae bacterium]